jgi:FMN-dependent NADH-azoreductase
VLIVNLKPESDMPNLLQINASLFAAQGQSSKLSDAMVESWRNAHPDGSVTVLDLSRNPVPHLSAERFEAFLTPAQTRSEVQAEIVAYSDALIEQLRNADVVVLGLPMYNFGVPSTLKAYFDHIARAGETFRYTANGPQGLLRGKKVYIFAARGGNYSGTPLDTQTAFVKDFFKFLGLDEVEFVYAEGLARDAAQRDAALADALAQIEKLAA